MTFNERKSLLLAGVTVVVLGGAAIIGRLREGAVGAMPPLRGAGSLEADAEASPKPFVNEFAASDALFLSTVGQIEADGGIETGSAGFHQFPGEGMIETLVHLCPVRRNEDGSMPLTEYGAIVRIARDEILQLGIEQVQIVNSTVEPGSHDVQVKFVASVKPYAESRQVARDFATQNGLPIDDLGVALVHNNDITGAFTYGAIYQAAKLNQWLTVAFALDATDALALQSLID